MNRRDAAADGPRRRDGSRTAGDGTPFAVDVSSDLPARTTIALFLAGPVIWSVHFMLVYLVVEAGCTGDGPGLRLFDPPVPTVVTLVATAAAALACLACAGRGYRRWRSGRQEAADEAGDLGQHDPSGSLAFAGFLMSSLGFVTVLFVGLPALVLPAC
ncbi:MAG: hypothetical protein M3415_06020 [Actinomycetota bacterium]|nr:hypothetical protein [Actinomycetota bacterium]